MFLTAPTWSGLPLFCPALVSVWGNHHYKQHLFFIGSPKVLQAVLIHDDALLLLSMCCSKGLIYAEESFVKNGRVIGGHNAAPNTWKWQVQWLECLLNCDSDLSLITLKSLWTLSSSGVSSAGLIQWGLLRPHLWRHHHQWNARHDCGSLHPRVWTWFHCFHCVTCILHTMTSVLPCHYFWSRSPLPVMPVRTVSWWASTTCLRRTAVSSTLPWSASPSIPAGTGNSVWGKVTVQQSDSASASQCSTCPICAEMTLPSSNWPSRCMTTGLCPLETFPHLMRRCPISSSVTWLAGESWTVRTFRNAQHLHRRGDIVGVFPFHSFNSHLCCSACGLQTHQVPLCQISCRRLSCLWWRTRSALSMTGGATLPSRPWFAQEVMESFLAAR